MKYERFNQNYKNGKKQQHKTFFFLDDTISLIISFPSSIYSSACLTWNWISSSNSFCCCTIDDISINNSFNCLIDCSNFSISCDNSFDCKQTFETLSETVP